MSKIYELSAKNINGENTSLNAFKGQAMLIVNVASACGLTPHYKGLQELFNRNKEKGFTVLGFPCNQFGAQEPGTHEEIKEFCETNFGVSFPLFAKIEVNGEGAHPIYQYLKSEIKGDEGEDIEWNFAKFLVDKNGKVIKRYHPKTDPADIQKDLDAIL